MLKWLKQNRNWFFSGIGVLIIVSVISLVNWLWNHGYIPTWIDSMRSQPMVTAIVILAGLLLITSSMLLSATVRRRQSLGYRKGQDADQPTSEDSIMSHEVIEDGLKYITDTILTNLAKYGGSITTTAIFENYRDGDKVQMFLEGLHLPENSQATIEFTRLLLLDDPSKEYEWLREFLSLKTRIQSTTHGFSVIPKILHIRSKRRPLIRYLSGSIPKVSATMVEFRRPINSESRHLVYFGFWGGHIEHSFGIVFRDHGMFTLTQRFLNVYQQRATLYEDSEQIPSLFFDPRVSLLRRIQDRLLELAEQRDDIVHLGLFGSRSLVENQFLSEKDCASHEADLDVVVVLAESCAINSAIKTTIINAIYAERFPNDSIPEIEFSNLDGKYYEIRADVHIDIQLHNKGDRC